MRTNRWLPAVALAAAACLSTPHAEAQTWLRWKKEAPVHDPATQTPRAVVVPAGPVAAARIESITPSVMHGPTITISEEPPSAAVAGRAVSAVPESGAPVSGLKPLPQEPWASSIAAIQKVSPPSHAPAQTQPATAVVGGASAPTKIADANAAATVPAYQSAVIVPADKAFITPAMSIVPALSTPTASAAAVAMTPPSPAVQPVTAPVAPIAPISAPASPPVNPSFLPAAVPATTLPASIENSAALAAPLEAPAVCADCATADELQATSARPRKGDNPPEGLEIQGEAKRRLLQSR